jgi:hypothetical protein
VSQPTTQSSLDVEVRMEFCNNFSPLFINAGQKPLGRNTFVLQLEDTSKEMVLEPVYLTEKLRHIIQMFGSIVSAC